MIESLGPSVFSLDVFDQRYKFYAWFSLTKKGGAHET
jgi:hypothetical protein